MRARDANSPLRTKASPTRKTKDNWGARATPDSGKTTGIGSGVTSDDEGADVGGGGADVAGGSVGGGSVGGGSVGGGSVGAGSAVGVMPYAAWA